MLLLFFEALFFTFFIGALAAVVALLVYGIFRERRRREAMRSLAHAEHWSFIERDRHDRPQRYRAFKIFKQGAAKQAYNIMTGTRNGVPFEFFAYQYTISTGKSSHTYFFKVAAIWMPLSAPDLTIERERLHHKIYDKLGGEDINFESDAFSRMFWVKCRDRRFAYDVIHTGMMTFLMANPRLHWEWRGDTLLLHVPGHVAPHEVKPLLDTTLRFHALLPRHLLSSAPQVRHAPAPGTGPGRGLGADETPLEWGPVPPRP